MAEIPVQPKRGVRPWVWIVAVILAVAVLWLIFGRDIAPVTTGSVAPAHVTPALATQTVPAPRAAA
ncbi:MAG TPA: hypothetical protein VFY16_10775 [Gemmatimonadaceae bacterium]|nr:hypothetical protein [Gemmatimonadaceae bacterium]